MAERKAAPRYVTPAQDPLWRQRSFNQEVEAFPLLKGHWVEGEFPAGAVMLRANHKLSRAYVGATAFLFTGGTLDTPVFALAPEYAKTIVMGGARLDPEREIYLGRASSASLLRLRFWVF